MRDLGKIWLYVAESSCRGYSPIYERICRTVAESEEVLDLVTEAPPVAHNPVLLLAAVHHLLLGGLDHPLAAVYAGESEADPGPLFVDLCLENREVIVELLATRQVNTNEVGRSAAIGPALTVVASRLSAPLGLVDVGCSAGLNLLCDRYRLDYGTAGATGPARAPVHIDCEIVGGSPPIEPTLPTISARIGLDRAPVDLRDPDQSRWQLACSWPDTGRLERTKLALDEARKESLTVIRGDAVEAVGGLVESLPRDATATVTSTWVVGYFSLEQRAAFRDALAAASASRPVAWISAETHGVIDLIPSEGIPSDSGGMEWSVLGLVIFRNGEPEPELLGCVHPHGSHLDWRLT